MKKLMTFLLVFALAAALMAGCGDTVSDIAGSVADAAKAELEAQVKATLEKNKVDVVELKTAVGKLNDEGSDKQLFVAALIRSESTDIPQACADTLGKIFTESGLISQSDSSLSCEYLVHKEIFFNHNDFSEGNYYVIYAYMEDLTIQIPTLGE